MRLLRHEARIDERHREGSIMYRMKHEWQEVTCVSPSDEEVYIFFSDEHPPPLDKDRFTRMKITRKR